MQHQVTINSDYSKKIYITLFQNYTVTHMAFLRHHNHAPHTKAVQKLCCLIRFGQFCLNSKAASHLIMHFD